MTPMICYGWEDFDEAADQLAFLFHGVAKRIIGVPRGGLCLAVALSHRLGDIPVLNDVPLGDLTDLLIVDDIIDTGKTYETMMRRYPGARFTAWVGRNDARGLKVATHIPGDAWIVFPWEVEEHAQADMIAYKRSRE